MTIGGFDVTQILTQAGAAYAAVQGIAQGMLALQRLGTSAPEKTIWFRFWKFIISGPSRAPVVPATGVAGTTYPTP